MEVPVSRSNNSGGRQLAVKSFDAREDASSRDILPNFPFGDFHRQFEAMEKQFAHFEPFSMFPFYGGEAGCWFDNINREIRKYHKQMMEFMVNSDINWNIDDLWRFPSMADCFTKDENGQTWFSTKFNLQAFDPEDIEVRVENQNLLVQAKHTRKRQNSSRKEYFCRAMLLPDGVRTEELTSELDKNGILTVRAPAPGVQMEILGPSKLSRIPIQEGKRRRGDRLKSRHHREARQEHVKEDKNGHRTLHITLPIDNIYSEEDIRIQCGSGKLLVEGEKGGSNFCRTFIVPYDVDPEQLEAKLYNGVLTIIGAVP